MAVAINLTASMHIDETRSITDSQSAHVQAARNGDRAAFAALHDGYATMVHAMLLARVPVNDAEDLVQDVFLHAMKKLTTLNDNHAFGPWLATITRNFALQLYRDRSRRDNLKVKTIAKSTSKGEKAAVRDDALRILEVLRELPDAYQETLILRLVEGLTGPQIATCTGLSPGSVRINLHRGMKMLREKLGIEARSEESQ